MTVTLYLVAETELARKFQTEQERGQIPRPQQFWLPRSQCKSCLKMVPQPGEKYRMCQVVVEDWLAEEKGLG